MLLLRAFVTGLLALVMQAAIAVPSDGAVGMVLDLQGAGQIQDKGEVSKLRLLAYLKPQMRIVLEAGSKASLSLYATRTVYQLTGPAVVEIAKDRLSLLEGKPPVAKSMAEKLVAAAENANVIPGAFRMRSIAPKLVIVSPENGSVLLDRKPTFSWAGTESASYDIAIYDDANMLVANTKIAGNKWQMPAESMLAGGHVYRWTVSYVSPEDNKVYSTAAHFSLATQAEAAQYAELKPAGEAAIEEWILYASMLQNRRMLGEARAVWEHIVKRRPDLERPQALAQ